jgi:hypothetical protein
MIDIYFDKTKYRKTITRWTIKLKKLDDELLICIRESINYILDDRDYDRSKGKL